MIIVPLVNVTPNLSQYILPFAYKITLAFCGERRRFANDIEKF